MCIKLTHQTLSDVLEGCLLLNNAYISIYLQTTL